MNIIDPIEMMLNAKPNKEVQHYINKAYYDAIYDTYKSIFKHQFSHDFHNEGILPYIPNDSKMQETIAKARDRVLSKPRNIFLTINPKPGHDEFKEFSELIDKFTKKKTIVSATWVYEIRKAPDKGLHCHMLLKYNNRPFDFKTSTKKYFSKCCDSKNPQCLNFRYVEEDDCHEKIEYMQGSKTKSKLPLVEATKKWRKDNNIQELYSTPQETQVSLVGVRTEDDKSSGVTKTI